MAGASPAVRGRMLPKVSAMTKTAFRLLRPARLALALLAGLALASPFVDRASGQTPSATVEVTDVAGRTVTVKRGAERVILGEGRLMYGTSILDKDKPFRRIVGWAEDMILFDPGTYRKYRTIFPEGDQVPRFGSAFNSDFSVEKAIALNPDVVIFPLSAYYKVRDTQLVEKLEKAGVPSVFIDLREDPLINTVPSMLVLGQIFGKEAEAAAFLSFYLKETRRITVAVGNKPDAKRPLVIMERAAGLTPDKCCLTFGNANLGAVLQAAGGRNWGTARFAGLGGDINPETLFAENPPVIIGTGADWAESTPGARPVPFGYETTPEATQAALRSLAERRGWSTLQAVQSKRFYGIYHQFYTSPAHLVALQVFAKWMHPEDFRDLDPAVTLAEYHRRFSPIPLTGVFWAELK